MPQELIAPQPPARMAAKLRRQQLLSVRTGAPHAPGRHYPKRHKAPRPSNYGEGTRIAISKAAPRMSVILEDAARWTDIILGPPKAYAAGMYAWRQEETVRVLERWMQCMECGATP